MIELDPMNSSVYTNIKSAVSNQLNGVNGIHSLKLQNHLYGCFIIMEDLAQHIVDLSGTILSTPKFIFDIDKQFSEIGIRYGFAMDTQLLLNLHTPEYKNTWIQCFKDVYLAHNIDNADKIEDSLIEIIQTTINLDEAFFINSLESGTLAQEWIEKIICLITASANTTTTVTVTNTPTVIVAQEIDEDIKTNAISMAITEKPIKHKHLSTTRRSIHKSSTISSHKKVLNKTRRNYLR